MIRRTFLAFCAAGLLTAVRSGRAQQERVFRVGWIAPGALPPARQEIIRNTLRNLGYIEGQNLILERRFGEPQHLPSMASELVRRNVEVIFAGGSSAVRAAQTATREVPIIAVDLETDPVASGLAASLARPDGNVTGFFLDLPGFSAKRLEVLKEALPAASHVLVLWDPSLDRTPLSGMDAAARTLKLHLMVKEVRTVDDIESAFAAAVNRKVQAAVVMQSPTLDGYKAQILERARKYRLPVFAMFANFTVDGALLSYGPNIEDVVARSMGYVDKVLRGAKPGDLPIQRPAKFDLFLNVKTAKALGLTIPDSILLRADDVIR
jgi:putative ABC transport system substrate-binding protein